MSQVNTYSWKVLREFLLWFVVRRKFLSFLKLFMFAHPASEAFKEFLYVSYCCKWLRINKITTYIKFKVFVYFYLQFSVGVCF